MVTRVFSAVFHKEDDLYVAECPKVGTVSQGYTIEEAVANLKEAAVYAQVGRARTDGPILFSGRHTLNPTLRKIIVESFHLLVVVSLLLSMFPVTGHTAPVRDPVATATITPQGGTLVTADGRVTFHFPPNAVSEAVEVTAATLAELPAPLPLDARYKEYGLDVQMRTQAKGDSISETLRPVTITLDYVGLPNVGNAASQRLLKFYHYDEGAQAWERLPAQVSPAMGVLTATASCFSSLAVVGDTQNDLGDYAEPWSPAVQDFQVDLFTGAATWQIPIDVPAGRGGLAPNLNLSYSSGVIDEMRGYLNPQVSWVGAGWNLGVGYIARAIERDENDTPTAVPTYTLVLNGVSSELVPAGGNQYRTKDERFWRIERVTTGAQNRGDDYWLVTTRDGTQYRFGYADETAGDSSILSAWWMLVQHPTPGVETLITVNWRWNLDQIEDPHGNLVRLEYKAEHNDFMYVTEEGGLRWKYYYSSHSPCPSGEEDCVIDGYHVHWAVNSGYVMGGHVRKIAYSRHEGGSPGPAYEITFHTELREDYPDDLDSGRNGVQIVQTFWTPHRLKMIEVRHTSGDLIRKYELEHDYLSYSGNPHHMLILNGVCQFDADEVGSLPPTTFSYHKNLYSYKYTYHGPTGSDGGRGLKPWLSGVTNGYGGGVSFNYTAPLNDSRPWQNGQTIKLEFDEYTSWYRYRVREVKAMPGIGPVMRTVYEYCNENGDLTGGTWRKEDSQWEFYGHQMVRVLHRDENKQYVGGYSQHYFHQGDGNATGNCGGNLQDPDGMQGREYRVVHYDDGGTRLAETVTKHHFETWGSGDDQRRFVGVDAVCEYAEDGSGVSRRTEYDHDTEDGDPNNDYGNVVQVREYESDAASTPYRTTTTSYVANTGAWIVDRASLIETYAGGAGGQKIAETRYFYDRDGDNLRPWGSAPAKGDLARVENRADLTADEYTAVDYWHDQWGNLTEERSYGGYGASGATDYAGPRATTTTYDTTYRQFPVEMCNALGQCTQVAYYGANDSNGLFGQVERVTDPKGAVTAFRYDRFGRLTTVKAHDDAGWEPGQVTARYEYLDLGQVGQQRVAAWSGRDRSWQESYFDGLGRTVQTHALSGSGREVRTTTGHDALGQAVKGWTPYDVARHVGYVAPDEGLPHTMTTYDALGRVTRVDHADGAYAQTSYSGWTRTAVDENGHQKRYTDDAFGRVAQVEEFESVYPSATIYATTEYDYDVRDNLTGVWADGHTNHIQVWYDPLGRKERMADPDMGEWEYGYDAVGNLEWQEDAQGQRIEFEYDVLNRLVRKRVSESANQRVLAEYGYDQGRWGIGHRTATTDTTGVTTWGYDARGRVISETRTLADDLGDYTTQWRYDAADRVTAMQYPTGEVVRASYDARGLVRSVTGYAGDGKPWVYASGASYNPLGQVEQMRLGSGLTTHYTYHERNFRLGRIQLPGLLDLAYGYDNVGNVRALTDTVRSDVSAFTYDALDRLRAASGAHAEQFSYDVTGNLEIKAGVDYDYLDAAHVHAVTHLNDVERYRYDANGNMIHRVSSGVAYRQEFDIENHLRVVTNTVSSVVTHIGYDGDGTRVWQSNGITTTVYLGDLVEVRLGPSSRVTRTYYYAGGQRVAVRVHDGEYAPLYYLHNDHLGSTSLATHGQREPLEYQIYLPLVVSGYDGSGSLPVVDEPPPLTPCGPVYVSPPDAPAPGTVVAGSETRYTSYGEARTDGEAVAGLTDFTYASQQVDRDTGLMYYDARWYDPALGRFISPDTIVPEPGNPQSLNRYTYVANNPLRYNDPSGHFVHIAVGAAIGAVIGAAVSAGPQMVQNIRNGEPLMTNVDPGQVAKAAAVGAVGGAVAGATFGVGLAVMGSGLGAHVAAGAVSGVVAGQAGRATDNVLSGREITAGLGDPTDIVIDAALGAAGGAAVYGVKQVVSGVASRLAMRKTAYNGGTASKQTFVNGMTPDEAVRYQQYWQQNAPRQIGSGPCNVNHWKISSRTGSLEHSRVVYDGFGRQIYRVDYSNHGFPGHTAPHLHQYRYGLGFESGWEFRYNIYWER